MHLAIEAADVDHLEVIELARETGLTFHDTSYLWLALHPKGELITLDKKLLKPPSKQRLNRKRLQRSLMGKARCPSA
jgi:predicted nucleic acid-binding protein